MKRTDQSFAMYVHRVCTTMFEGGCSVHFTGPSAGLTTEAVQSIHNMMLPMLAKQLADLM